PSSLAMPPSPLPLPCGQGQGWGCPWSKARTSSRTYPVDRLARAAYAAICFRPHLSLPLARRVGVGVSLDEGPHLEQNLLGRPLSLSGVRGDLPLIRLPKLHPAHAPDGSLHRQQRASAVLVGIDLAQPLPGRLRVLVASFRSARPASQSASSDRRIRA